MVTRRDSEVTRVDEGALFTELKRLRRDVPVRSDHIAKCPTLMQALHSVDSPRYALHLLRGVFRGLSAHDREFESASSMLGFQNERGNVTERLAELSEWYNVDAMTIRRWGDRGFRRVAHDLAQDADDLLRFQTDIHVILQNDDEHPSIQAFFTRRSLVPDPVVGVRDTPDSQYRFLDIEWRDNNTAAVEAKDIFGAVINWDLGHESYWRIGTYTGNGRTIESHHGSQDFICELYPPDEA